MNFFNKYTDPHSDYFGALANYGIFGFLSFLIIPLYFIFYFFYYFKAYIIDIKNLNYFLIILIFLIQGLVLDFLHNQMIWIMFSLFNVNLYLNLKKFKFNSSHF
jgi:O-antigen ligase